MTDTSSDSDQKTLQDEITTQPLSRCTTPDDAKESVEGLLVEEAGEGGPLLPGGGEPSDEVSQPQDQPLDKGDDIPWDEIRPNEDDLFDENETPYEDGSCNEDGSDEDEPDEDETDEDEPSEEEKQERKIKAEQERQEKRQKTLEEVQADLAKLVGIDPAKRHFKAIRAHVEHITVLGLDDKQEKYHVIFQGNPGLGTSNVLI